MSATRRRREPAPATWVGDVMAKGLEFDEATGAGLHRLLQHHLEAAIAAALTPDQPVADRIHQTRTRLKRVRALLRFLRKVDPGAARDANRLLRDAMQPLSALRDGDVRLATFDMLLAHFGAGGGTAPATTVRRSLLRVRRHEQPSISTVSRRLRAAATAARRVQRGPLLRRAQAVEIADLLTGLRSTCARTRAAFRQARRKASATAFHDWRKRTKDLRYQLRLFRAGWPRVVKTFERELGQVADLLGDEHDLFLLKSALQRLDLRPTVDLNPLLELIVARRAELRREALALGARLFGAPPRATTKLLCRWWLLSAKTARDHLPATDSAAEGAARP